MAFGLSFDIQMFHYFGVSQNSSCNKKYLFCSKYVSTKKGAPNYKVVNINVNCTLFPCTKNLKANGKMSFRMTREKRCK